MSTTIKININKLLINALITFGCFACESKEIFPNVQNSKIYDLRIKAVATTAEGYAILSDSVWFSVNSSGKPSKYYSISFNLKNEEEKYTSDILYYDNSIYVLASIYSIQEKYIDLGILQYSISGEIINRSRIKIADEFKVDDLIKKKHTTYTIPFSLYAKGLVLPSAELVVAFNYIGKEDERWRYSLLHLSKDLNLINRENYLIQSFLGWVYKIKQIDIDQFVMTRGGNDWYAIDQFDLNLKVKSKIEYLSNEKKGLTSPVLTNILYLSNQKFIFTGYIDKQDNPETSVSTNYDFWFVSYDEANGLKEKFIEGSNTNMELCFDSYITEDNKLILAGAKRGYNQTTLDLSSQVQIIETDIEGKAQNTSLLTNVGGMEALFIHKKVTSESFNIIGRKRGFDDSHVQTFFRTVKDFKNE